MRLWVARLLIGVVIAWNLQAAFIFFTWPGAFAPGFELSGIPGEAAMRGIAVLFVMWNVPYIVAAWHPLRQLTSVKEAVGMQLLGLAGESAIYLSLSPAHAALQGSILRFISFDGSGLILLLAALWLVRAEQAKKTPA